MSASQKSRKLAAVIVADVVGYSKLVGLDEEGTLARLRNVRKTLIEPGLATRDGRMVKWTGDGFLADFRSIVEGLRFALELQEAMERFNSDVSPELRLLLRIGAHLGDVVEEIDGDLMGDGVNVAARLEGLAEPGGVAVSAEAWRTAEGALKVAAEDTGEHRLKNIARPVGVYRLAPSGKSAARPANRDASHVVPSLAVLPFENLAGDPEQDVFCDGLVDDLVTTFSKLGGLRVIARHSSFAFRGQHVDVRDVARRLGVQYVLEGSVQRGGDRLRITVRLVDASDGAQVWSERYDRTTSDLFAVQDEITLTLATELQVSLTEGEQARLRYATTSNFEAWTHWARGLAAYRRGVSRDNVSAALTSWEKALALDPSSAPLCGMIGWMHALCARFDWTGDRADESAKALNYARRALQIDPENPDANATLAGLMWIERRFEEASAHIRRAVALAPGSADLANIASFYLANAGHADEAVALSRKAMSLNPSYPPMYLGNLGFALRMAGRSEEAMRAFEDFDARAPNAGFGLADLVILYTQAGRAEAAAAAARRLAEARPQFTVGDWVRTQVRLDEQGLTRDADALTRAGLPE